MHAISSYCGNRPIKNTNTQTHRQERLHCTAKLSTQCNDTMATVNNKDRWYEIQVVSPSNGMVRCNAAQSCRYTRPNVYTSVWNNTTATLTIYHQITIIKTQLWLQKVGNPWVKLLPLTFSFSFTGWLLKCHSRPVVREKICQSWSRISDGLQSRTFLRAKWISCRPTNSIKAPNGKNSTE